MGKKGMQSQLRKTGKDDAIYEKAAEGHSLRGCRQDKKHVVSKIKNMLVFLHPNWCFRQMISN